LCASVCVLCVSVVNLSEGLFTTETRCTRRMHREESKLGTFPKFLILLVCDAGTFKGTIRRKASYIQASPKKATSKNGAAKIIQEALGVMKEAKDVLRLAGMLLLGLFVLVVGVPLVLTAAGIALGIFGFLFGLAVLLIKVAIVVAVIYLILVGVRAVLR